MEFLIILILAGAVALLWSRTTRLERSMADLAERFGEIDPARFERFRRESEAPVVVEPGAPDADPEEGIAPQPVGTERREPAPDPASKPLEPSVPVEDIAPGEPEPAFAYEAPSHDAQTVDSGQRFAFDFEDIFGRRLPIWGGGLALAIAGIFLVRFSIEAGLLTPLVRVGMSFAFGLALLAGAETAYRQELRVNDPRVRQALAGAGIATLYGAFYLAGTGYGLIGAGAAFVGLAIVTAAAIGLSFRFGLPCAVIGLVGGFATPLLVDSDGSNIALLSFYLALIAGGLAWSGEAQGRSWLGYAALAAGLGWGVLMMLAGVSNSSDFAALGIYLVVLGSVLPAFLHSKGGPSVPKLAASAIATLQMAVLVSDAGFAPLTWGLYLLIGAALTALGWKYPTLRLGALVAAGLGLWLLLIWPDPEAGVFAAIALSQVAIFAGVPLTHQWLGKARLLDIAQLGAVTLVLGIVVYSQFGSWSDLPPEPGLALVLALLALLPVAAFAQMWIRREEHATREALSLIAPGAILLFAALVLITPAWLAPVMAAIITLMLLSLYWLRDAMALQTASWAGAIVILIALTVTPGFESEAARLGSAHETVDTLRALLRWGAAALPFVGMALIARRAPPRGVAEAICVALLYGVIAQFLPSAPLAWIAALAAIGLMLRLPLRNAAWAMALVIAGLWALEPFAKWLEAGTLSLVGDPFLSDSAISLRNLALRFAPFAAALGVLFWKGKDRGEGFGARALLGFAIIAGVAVHSLYKQVWGLDSLLDFELYGMGERTVWQAALMLGAYGLSQTGSDALRRRACLAVVAAALAHFTGFTLLLHNPLLTAQHVGPTPIANWLTPAYLAAIGGIVLAVSQWGHDTGRIRRVADIAIMLLVALLAYSLLRQVFAGSVLTSRAIGDTESLLISMMGIVLALGFLWWGSWRKERSWRIGSLVLMLVAVVKVFLVDAAGLGGLLRIASFMALGFSLIGIGWVYSRQLSRRTAGEG